MPLYLIALPYFYGLPRLGGVIPILIFAVPFVLSVSGLGLVVAAIFKNPLSVQLVLAAIGMPFFFLAGFAWPAEVIPPAVHVASLLVPSTSATNGFTWLAQLGAPLADVRGEFLMLWGLTIFYGGIVWTLEVRRPSTGPPKRANRCGMTSTAFTSSSNKSAMVFHQAKFHSALVNPTNIQEKTMTSDEFQGLLLRDVDGAITATVETLQTSDLPDGDVTVRVEYSDINYKDGMAITGIGHRRIAQFFPFIPGIDFAGVVEDSRSTRFAPGDRVVLTGWGVGEKWWGGHAQKARVKAEWLVPLPDGMTTRTAMALGTAGFTAMLCVDALDRHGIDRSREVLVTGAAGGVGSVSVMLLKRLGYRVVASTGRAEEEDYLRGLGAESVIARSELSEPSQPLLPERWAGVIDTVGSHTLATALAATVYDGAVTAVGLVAGRDLPTTVLPFIMRSVTLIGIDSVYCPPNRRQRAWQRLTELLPEGLPNQVIEEIGLSDLPERAAAILKGNTRGRLVVKL